MAKSGLEEDANHWQRRAEEARRIAHILKDPFAKRTMEEIARSYDRLAALAKDKRAKK
jgi:hypothetical protein